MTRWNFALVSLLLALATSVGCFDDAAHGVGEVPIAALGPGHDPNAPGHDPNAPGHDPNAPGHDPNVPGWLTAGADGDPATSCDGAWKGTWRKFHSDGTCSVPTEAPPFCWVGGLTSVQLWSKANTFALRFIPGHGRAPGTAGAPVTQFDLVPASYDAATGRILSQRLAVNGAELKPGDEADVFVRVTNGMNIGSVGLLRIRALPHLARSRCGEPLDRVDWANYEVSYQEGHLDGACHPTPCAPDEGCAWSPARKYVGFTTAVVAPDLANGLSIGFDHDGMALVTYPNPESHVHKPSAWGKAMMGSGLPVPGVELDTACGPIDALRTVMGVALLVMNGYTFVVELEGGVLQAATVGMTVPGFQIALAARTLDASGQPASLAYAAGFGGGPVASLARTRYETEALFGGASRVSHTGTGASEPWVTTARPAVGPHAVREEAFRDADAADLPRQYLFERWAARRAEVGVKTIGQATDVALAGAACGEESAVVAYVSPLSDAFCNEHPDVCNWGDSNFIACPTTAPVKSR